MADHSYYVLHEFAKAYAAMAIKFAYFYVSLYNDYLANIDLGLFIREALYVNLGLLSDLFVDVDLVELVTYYYEHYVLYPLTYIGDIALRIINAYIHCFENDYITALDKKLRVYLCDFLGKPQLANKDVFYILLIDNSPTNKKLISNPAIAEVYQIIGLIGGATVYFVALGYFTLVLFYGAFLVLAFIARFLFGYDTVEDSSDESAANYVESEKELGSIDDFVFVFTGLALIYSLYMGIFVVYTYGAQSFLFMISVIGFPLLVSVAISLPVCFIYDCGLGFVAYLRGSGNTTIFALEFLYDTLAAAIMFIRLSIQNVRFLLIFFAYFEMFEFLNVEFYINEHSWAFFQYLHSNIQTSDSVVSALYLILVDLPRVLIHGIYILGHLFYTFVSNFVCFVVLMFWFFSFLYTMFYNEKMEFYLKKKRASREKLISSL